PPRTRPKTVRLEHLSGVRRGDGAGDARLRARTKPRLSLSPAHALAAILLLAAALSASLTMLVQQARNIAALEEGAATAMTDETDAERSGRDTAPPPQDADAADDAADEANVAGPAPAPQQTPPPATDSRVDLNTADLTQLDAIAGIGPVLAQRILDHRHANGAFTSVDQLLEVKGIGPKTLEKLRGQVKVG
ncbi:ComEA family DNA-binding protein, partial [Bifidobacterium pullorum]|uniref:ComEA family DNA-binding protein n=1 Tax=Bifidobacterium pullorum TaxID=78448 RepID=UPI0027B9C8EA